MQKYSRSTVKLVHFFLIEKTIQLNHNSQFKTFNLILFLIFKEKT